MEALFSSTLAVALAEIGDKTQLLALLLISRYNRPYTIAAGILVATLINHALSALLGTWLVELIPPHWIPLIISASFVVMAIWMLIPDKCDGTNGRFHQYGPFIATLILFFLAEIGDKTQIATVVLAAKYEAFTAVVVGTTLGMLLANLPILFAGRWLLERVPQNYARISACLVFVILAVVTLVRTNGPA